MTYTVVLLRPNLALASIAIAVQLELANGSVEPTVARGVGVRAGDVAEELDTGDIALGRRVLHWAIGVFGPKADGGSATILGQGGHGQHQTGEEGFSERHVLFLSFRK